MANAHVVGVRGAGAWNDYWRLTSENAAHRAGGPQDEALSRFWSGVCSRQFEGSVAGRVLDFACGNGAVTEIALKAAGAAGAKPVLIGFDGARTAADAYRVRFPGALAVVADAIRTPFPDGAFDVVASQFGLEYAGIGAVDEAARLVARGGVLAAVVHRREGALFRECEANLRAVERVQASRMLATAKEAFRRGTAAIRGHGSRSEFQRAEERFAAAVTEVDRVLGDYGDGVAGGTVHRMYSDLGHMYRRLGAFDPAEVALWADRMEAEVDAYAGRMSAMVESALDAAGLRDASARVQARGLSVRTSEELRTGREGEDSAAWVLVCDRP